MLANLKLLASSNDSPVSSDEAKGLGVFRIGIALSVLIKSISYYPYLDLLYGEFGMLQKPITEAASNSYIPTTFAIVDVLKGWGFESLPVTEALLVITIVSALTMGVGWHARTSAISCWLSTAILTSTGAVFHYGVDSFQLMGLFYCSVFAVDRAWSVQRNSPPATEASASWLPLWILRLHICLIYFSAGFWKLWGEQWWNGAALWRALLQPLFLHPPFSWLDLQALAHFKILFLMVGLAVAVTQLSFPILVFIKPLRPFILAAMILFHAGIGLFLGLYLFSFTMIVYDIAAFYNFSSKHSAVRNFGSLVRNHLKSVLPRPKLKDLASVERQSDVAPSNPPTPTN